MAIAHTLCMEEYQRLARRAGAEGCVLLKNDGGVLPLPADESVALFGRFGYEYYKSGVGSGGMVNAPYVVGIADALRETPQVALNEQVAAVYAEWLAAHPHDHGHGWGTVPWHQEEMPLSAELAAQAAAESRTAIAVIGRTAGEDEDNKAEAGSYLLTETEQAMLATVCAAFEKTIVILNVGNIIDMKWVETCRPAAVLYAWQGGQEGGHAVADILTGAVNPSGRLTDTIARDITDYPAAANYGDPTEAIYQEDVYVGYRYFETFAPNKVLYPFGFGLSYTTFTQQAAVTDNGHALRVDVTVRNTGSLVGQEVVQLYVQKPQGRLGKPTRELIAFDKTGEISPASAETRTLTVDKRVCASYDDSGAAGHAHCWVLEAGEYTLYAGANVRDAVPVGSFAVLETQVVQTCRQALAPVRAFDRMRPTETAVGYAVEYESVPLSKSSMYERLAEQIPTATPYTGDQGYRLQDVAEGRVEMCAFLAQLSDEALCCIVRGEGMNSPKVTPGTGGAFGGVTEELLHFGIPIACCTDGPSGLRMDCGTLAFSLPNGTLLGCTWNLRLLEALYAMTGWEMRQNNVDLLLGPGINLHRHPLNGRNFEYISEDPLLTGEMAAAQLLGMQQAGVSGTLKHFCGNNQEFHRHCLDSVVSERALRELYLKCFEIPVKQAGAYSVMTTYGAVNGVMTAGSYDLVTEILRHEWGFEGIVMTDWWAGVNKTYGGESQGGYRAEMVRAQNDLYMVTDNAKAQQTADNLASGLTDGSVTRGELQRCAENICRVILRSPVMARWQEDAPVNAADADDATVLERVGIAVEGTTEAGQRAEYDVQPTAGTYRLRVQVRADGHSLAQLACSVFWDGVLAGTVSLHGAQEWVTRTVPLPSTDGGAHRLTLYFAQSGMEIGDMALERLR